MNRRDFMKVTAGTMSALAFGAGGAMAGPDPQPTAMGLVLYSFSRNAHTQTTLDFLEYCHSFGAAGVQTTLDSTAPDYTAKIRRRAEELGMYFEGIISLPVSADTSEFEQTVMAIKQAGATCLRTACLSGRRYEDFASLEQWLQFAASAHRRIEAALPIFEKHKIAAGIENHKDWTADELVGLLKHYDSEYLGACLDFGNNISLLDEPMDAIRKLAPYAVTTHVKNMAVKEYPEGFLLAGVPLAEGLEDLRQAVATISKARPRTKFNLEMITRDPLKVPCLTDKYWVTFPARNGICLARTLRMVRNEQPSKPLPIVSTLGHVERMKVEEENVRECLHYAREHLDLAPSA
jgi:3-oxoisoapionate decarboxylase